MQLFRSCLVSGRLTAAALLLAVLPALASVQHRPARKTPPHTAAQKSAARHGVRTRKLVVVKRRGRHRLLTARDRARAAQIQHAFVASTQLRPMAQQLGNYRSAAAYAAVEGYAHAHAGGPGAAAAYLALGHAYLLDYRYPDALGALRLAAAGGSSLGDYTDYFAAQAYLQSSQLAEADAILSTFAAKHADSVFAPQIPVLEANLLLEQNHPDRALALLTAHAGQPLEAKPDAVLAQAKAYGALGRPADALLAYRRVLDDAPLSPEAAAAKQRLQQTGEWLGLPLAERRRHADALFNGGKFAEASGEFRTLATDPALNASEQNGLLLSAAACDFKQKKLSAASLASIPDSGDDNGAHRLYLLMEVARNNTDLVRQQDLVAQLRERFATSQWLAEALMSSGNLYMLRHDYPSAIPYYLELARRFPQNKYADNAHWRAAWLSYRVHNFPQAAQLMDEELLSFRDSKNIPAALYWRGRLYEDQDHNPALAAAYYGTETRVFGHFYYAAVARERLQELGAVTPVSVPSLLVFQPQQIPTLTEDVPDDDPHLAKARLLANAGLNDYIGPEIHAAEGADGWGALAEAKLYASFGETSRALRALKRALPFYTSAPLDELPNEYWRILFPEPYWSSIQREARANNLDPYMVASLIRQESEFNPRVISYANAYGLMQIEPFTGKDMARKLGLPGRFDPNELLDPEINIRLGCAYLRQTLDRFGGQQEYAFASYNAGESRVDDWKAAGPYTGIDEWVESIPFEQTRDYVQALMRNEIIYRELDQGKRTVESQTRTALNTGRISANP